MTQRGLWGSVMFGLGFIFCPCHLPVTLPLLGAWLGGTAFTGMAWANVGLVTVVSSVLFVGFVALGWRLLNQRVVCGTGLSPSEVKHDA